MIGADTFHLMELGFNSGDMMAAFNSAVFVVGAKGRNRVKRTVNKGTTVRVVQQAPCACVIVGPKVGDKFLQFGHICSTACCNMLQN